MAEEVFEDVGQFAARCRNCGYIYNSVAWLLNSMWICCPHCGYGVTKQCEKERGSNDS